MLHSSWLAIAAIVLAPPAFAASDAAQENDPSSPAASTSSVHYTSVLESYRPVAEDDAAPDQVWRAANEEVGRIGGHAGYMKTQEPSSPAAHKQEAPSSQAPKPATTNHGSHHGMHH